MVDLRVRPLLPRPHLDAVLDGDADVVLVLGDAGFGKSSLLRGWCERSVGEANLVRIDFERLPRRAVSVAQALTDAIAAAIDIGDHPALDGLPAVDGTHLGAAFVAAAARAARARGRPWTLVLDDVHLLPEALGRDLGAFVDAFATDGWRVIAAGRHAPPWPLAAWRATGRATELVGSELVKRAADRAKRKEERLKAQREGREEGEEES